MLAKLCKRLKPATGRPDATLRHWTAKPFGRSVLAAESGQLQELVHAPGNRRIIELASMETPACGLPVIALFAAAQQSWREPVIASLTHLPLLSRSVDVLLWRYLALDAKSRRWLLQEAERVLAPNGILLCSHLNPVYSACWRHAALLNLGYQSATAIVPAATMAGLQLETTRFGGPGWWQYRALRISRFRKPMASRVLSKLRARSMTQRPATAMYSSTVGQHLEHMSDQPILAKPISPQHVSKSAHA